MRMRIVGAATLAAAVLVAFPDTVPAQQPDAEAMMAAYQKAATPGPEHDRLARLAGKYSLRVRSWPVPGAPPEERAARSELQVVLGGRYVVEEWEGNVMGHPAAGRGTYAYDNVEQRYVSTWMDTMGTGILLLAGAYDPATTSIVQTGGYTDPLTGEARILKMVLTLTDGGMVNQLFDVAADGSETTMMEITYTKLGT